MANAEDMEMDIADIPEVRSSVGLCGFMEVVVHHLMYVKNIYPKEAFIRSERNGVPLWMCPHPALKKYVLNFLNYANKVLMATKEVEILFSLCRRNKEVLEEYYFKFKVNDFFVESESELVCLLDSLISICEDIQKSNTFTGFNTIHSGQKEITFELNLVLDPKVEIPEDDSDVAWVVYPAPSRSKSSLKNVTTLKNERNKTYEVKAYARKKD